MNRSLPLLLAVLLTACSGGDDPAPAVDPEPAAAPAAATPPPPPPSSGLTIDPGSTISFVSTKNEGVEVPGSWTPLSGELAVTDDDLSTLTGTFTVPLAALDTANPARDLSIREALFGLVGDAVGDATVTVTKVRPEVARLAPGDSTDAAAELDLTLLGTTTHHNAKIRLGRTETGLTVSSAHPLDLSMVALGLGENAAALKARCGHAQLGDNVAISIELTTH